MKEQIYTRKGRTITGKDLSKTFKSINEAKRESRKLQAAHGLGSVRVAK